MPPKAATATGTGEPRTILQLAQMGIRKRSDFANWCKGYRRVCDQMAALAVSMESELYEQLIAKHGRDYDARHQARKATRPLRHMAAAMNLVGLMAPRAFRNYARVYAHEIAPPPRNGAGKFDHRN